MTASICFLVRAALLMAVILGLDKVMLLLRIVAITRAAMDVRFSIPSQNVEAKVSLSAICVWATITMLSVNRHLWIDFRCPSADTAFKVFHPGYSCAGKERQHLRGTYSGATHQYVLMCAV